MGYSHYCRAHKDGIPQDKWNAICADVKHLLSHLPKTIKVAREYDDVASPPVVSDALIRFNGIGNDGHETFYFKRIPDATFGVDDDNTVFRFCKTADKPYDLAVCGCLIVIYKHAGDYVSVSSDGNKADWLPAAAWVKEVLGAEYPIPPLRE